MYEIKVLAILPILVNCFWLSNSLSLPPQQPFGQNPTDNYCSSTCPSNEGSEPTIIKYKDDEIYRYRLEGLTSIHTFDTLREENTKLTYSAFFDIIPENRCSFLLRVSNIEVIGLDGKKYTDSSLAGSVARFSFNNGRLEKLCLDAKETEISANFKRSILSNLQISSWGNPITGPGVGTSFHETDVYGRCPVSLETTQEPNGSWLVKKSKDVNQCKHLHGQDFTIKTDPFQTDGSYTNPFVDASLRSVLKVDKGIVKTCEVNEEYTYQPLTKYADSQTSVVVTTRIVLIGSKSGSIPGPVNPKPASLLYETVKSYRSDVTMATLIKAIQDASHEEEPDVVPTNAAKTFSHFVSILQEVNKNELLIAHDQVKSKAGFKNSETAMKVFWGGLLSAGTPATTEAAATLLMNKEMPEDRIPEFMASLAFVKHPTEETLNVLSPLLDGPNVEVDRYLAIGSLIQRYISNNPHNESPELRNLLGKLSTPLKNGLNSQTVDEQDLVIAGLKGLRNARYLSSDVSSLVRSYATNKDVPLRVRIAALQTLAVNSSDEATKKTALALFQSKEEDSELRIAAFLVYTDSPNAETAITVKNLLDEELSDQVGSFIVSWIRNLKTTADPKKAHKKYFYGNIKSKNKFPADFRQFSQNYHFSQLFPSLNSGYSTDASVIFSSTSYVPRSTSLNLDASLFGNSVNLFGLNARFENIEFLLEKMLGPRSYLRSTKAEDLADDLSEMAQNLGQHVASKASLFGRGKREIHNLEETVSQLNQKLPVSEKYMDFDFSLSMFETEVCWSKYHTNKNVVASGEYLDHLFRKIQQSIDNAKDMDVNYKRYSRIPILSNNVIHQPTSSGFPLRVSVNAHSAVNFKLKGKVDTAEILKNPKSSDVQLLVMPSAVVDIEGLLEIDAYVLSAGLKISSTLRSATSLKINFKSLDGNGVDLRFGLPTKEDDFLTMKTEAFTTIRERGLSPVEVPLNSNGKKYQYENTFKQLAELTGLALHTEINIPSVGYRPTIGTGVFSVRLIKIDELLQDYQLRFFYNRNLPNYRSVEFLFDTPGSQINRKIMFFAEANTHEKKGSLKFVSAKKEFIVDAHGENADNEVYCLLKLRNDASEYSAKVGATVTTEGYRTTYKPYLEFKSPLDAREATLEKHRLTPRDNSQPFTLEGLVILDRKPDSASYRLYNFQKLAFISPFGKFVLNGRVLLESQFPRYGSDLVLTYGNENTLSVKTAWNYTKNLEEDKRLLAAIAVMSSQWPLYNFKSTLNYNRTPTSHARTLTLTTGADLENENAKLTIKEILNMVQNPNTGEIISSDGTFGFIYPSWKTDINLAFEQANRDFFSGSAAMQLDKTNLVLNGSVGIGKTKPGNIEVTLESQMNEKHLHLTGVRELVDEETSKITVDVTTKPGKQLHMVMDLTHRLKPHNYVLRSNSVITVLPDNRVYKQDIGLTYTPTQKKFHVIFSPNNVKNLEISLEYLTSSSGIDSKVVLFVLNSLEGAAALKAGSGNVDGNLRLEVLKMSRLITGDLKLQVHDGTHYTGHGELLWDASKDKSKKIRIETNTLISEDHREIISENDVRMMNFRFQVNGNISIDGDLLNSTVDSHIQLVVSNGSSMGVIVHREYNGQEAVHNYNLHLEGYYVPVDVNDQVEGTFNVNVRDLDWSNYLFDLGTNWTLDLAKSKSLKHGIEIKRVLKDNHWTVGANMYVDGTIAIKSLNLSAQTEYSDLVNDYGLLSKERSLEPSTLHLHASVGKEYVFDSAASVHNSEISNVLELKVPIQNKSMDLKWTTKNKVDIAPAKHVNLRTTNSATWNNNFANWNGELAVFSKNGNFALEWDSSEIAKRSMEVFYVFDDSQEGNLTGPYGRVGVNLKFDGKVANCVGKLEFSKDLSTKVLTIVGQSPKNGSFEIRAETRVEDFGQRIFQDLLFESNGKRWYTYSDIATYPTKPMVDLLYSSPEAESKFMISFEERIRHYWTGAINISLMHGVAGYVKLVGELKLDNKDDIFIKADLDAPSFGVNNFSLVANNKAMEAGKKRISFTAQMDQAALFAGSSSYIYHADSTKLTFEGAGTVKIDDKNHPFTFKYYKVQLVESTSGETGSASKLYVSVDNKKHALDLECKFTDKSVMLKRDLWRGDKCYKMDISYQIKMIDVTNYEKNLLIHLDLKPHIPNGELFVIEGKTTRTLSNYDQKLSLLWAPEKKVEYIINSSPGKSGIIINLPKRQLAAEAVYIYDLGATNGKVETTTSVWFDKTHDDSKKLLFSSDIEYRIPENQNSFVLRSSADLHIPTLPKTLSANTSVVISLLEQKSIDVKTELDVFKTPEQMITVTYELFKGRQDNGYKVWSSLKAISEGQKMNTELKRSVTFYLDHMDYQLSFAYDNSKGVKKVAAIDLEFRPLSIRGKIAYDNFTLEGKSEVGLTRNSIELRENLILFGHDYKKTVTLTLDPSIVVLIQWKGASEQAVMMNASLAWNRALDVTLSLRDKNDVRKPKGDITRFKLLLTDKRFMNTETEFLIDQAKILLDDGKQELLSLIEDAKRRSKAALNEAGTQYAYRSKQYRNANLDMKPVITSSNAYLIALREEIKNDPSIVSASQNVRKIISSIVDFVFVILEQMSSFLGDWFYGYDIISEKLGEFFDEVVTLANKMSQLSMDEVSLYMRDSLNQLWRLAFRFIEYAKANKTKWRDAIISVSDSVRDTFKVASESFAQFKKDAQEFYERLKAYLESLPLTNYLKDRFAQLKDSQVIQYVWSAVREAGENLKEYMPNEELKTLISMILSTMDKIVNEKPYNLENELRAIYKQLMECLSLLAVKAADGLTYVKDVSDSYDYSLPQLSLSSFKSLPNLWTSSVSFIYWLREIEIPSANDVLETFDVGSLNSLELLPPFTKVGLIVNGQQIVTMNGLHYSINSDCQYLLAADFVNLNFTLIATVKDGKMSSLIVTSDQQTVELYSNGMPALNKVRQDFPIYTGRLSVIRNPTSVEIYIDNSVYIYCSLSLDIVMIQISGFYYAQVFGLMGSTTSESYLDLTMPNMSVARDLPTFIKSYQVSKKCRASTPATDNDLGKSSECTAIFGGRSLIRRGSSQIKAKAYLAMCEEMVARESTPADRLNAACKAALAFSVVSYTRGYYITLPTACSHCTMNGKDLAYGYADSVNVPTNSAEIFILLDKSESSKILYQELLMHAMKNIRSSLAQRNIRDLNFVLIGFADDQYASLQTTNGEVTLTENTNIKFSTAVRQEPSSKLGRYVRNVKQFLGLYEARRALEMLNNYPFRPEAVNSIIQVDANTREYNVLDKYSIYSTLVNTYVSWNIMSNKMPVYMLTPRESISIDVDNSSKDVFGFDLISIFTVSGPHPFKDGILNRLKLLEMYGGSVMLPAATNGAIYNSSVFVNSDSATRNKLTNVFSNRLIEGLVNVERSVECVCQNKWGVYSDLKCTLIRESPKIS